MLTITSTQTINDNVWHEIRMVRDRSLGKLFLYVDGISAATPLDDNFTIPLTNDRPLTLGASLVLPDYFTGSIDEVAIFRGARHPISVMSDTLALYHLNETTTSTVIDSSIYRNDGIANGTTIVPGRLGTARNFNGFGDYVRIPNPIGGIWNFSNSQSFTVSAWVKTSGTEGIIVRRGLVPVPGFHLSIHFGRAIGIIGNHKGNSWNDTLLTMTSTQLINDNVWHEIRMVRDRSQGKLFLYVDGISATTPQIDNFTTPLTNDWPLTFGASLIIPDYFTGSIDEVAIFRGARHPSGAGVPVIEVSPPQLNFGNVFVGTNAVRDITVRNVGFFDALRVTGISSNNPRFASNASAFSLPPGVARNVQVTYTPTAARIDTGSLSISSNDTTRPVVREK